MKNLAENNYFIKIINSKYYPDYQKMINKCNYNKK